MRSCRHVGFATVQQECNSSLNEEYHTHVNPLRNKLSTLPKGSKRWSDHFAEKCVLPPERWQSHIGQAACQLTDFILIRQRWTLAALRGINVDKATGPDFVPGKVLRECASELASPLTRSIRRLVRERRWPDLWRLHWIAPLFKKTNSVVSNELTWRASNDHRVKSCGTRHCWSACDFFGDHKCLLYIALGVPSST